jgi:hypothetical protein
MSTSPLPNYRQARDDGATIMVETEFWKFISSELTDEDVRIIAAADYGNDDDENVVGLRCLLSADACGFKLEWHPKEVLELTRWQTVVESDPIVQQTGVNRRCVFAAAALLCASCVPINEGRIQAIAENLAILLVSHSALNWQRLPEFDNFLAKLEIALRTEFDDEMAFVSLARGIIASERGPQHSDDASLHFHRAFDAAWRYRKEEPITCTRDKSPWSWVLQTTFFTQRISFWQSLLERSLDSANHNNSQSVITELIKLRDTQDFQK